MYCRKCGKEISGDSVFCPSCGEKVNQNDVPSNEISSDSSEKDETNDSDSEKSDDYDIEGEQFIILASKVALYVAIILTLLGLLTFKILIFIATAISILAFIYFLKACDKDILEDMSPSSRPKIIQNRKIFLMLSVITAICSIIKLYISQ